METNAASFEIGDTDQDNVLIELRKRIDEVPAGAWSFEHEPMMDHFDEEVVTVVGALGSASTSEIFLNYLRVNQLPVEVSQRIHGRLHRLVSKGVLYTPNGEHYELANEHRYLSGELRPHPNAQPDKPRVVANLDQPIEQGLRQGQPEVLTSLKEYLFGKQPQEVRGYVSAPTGSGKTVIFSSLLEDLRLRGELPRTIIAVPTKQLIRQTYRELSATGFNGSVKVHQGGLYQDDGESDVVLATYAMLARDTAYAPKLKKSYYIPKYKPVRTMYGIDPDSFGLMILDEAHHLQGEGTQRALSKRFPHAAQLGFTATPDYDEERQLKHVLPDVIHEISTTEAIDLGLIAPYQTALLVTAEDLSHVRVTGKEYAADDLDKAINNSTRNIAIAKFAAEHLASKRTLFNTGTVAHAQALAEALRDQGIKAHTVFGGQDIKEQEQILQAFHEGKITALTQAKLLSEGYDEVGIEVVVNVRPTLSLVREKQRTGRGQRIDNNNPDKVLLVIDCLDTGYKRNPVFYGHPNVTGHWGYAPSGTPEAFQSGLDRMSTYHDGIVNFISDPVKIESWQHDNNSIFNGLSFDSVDLPALAEERVSLSEVTFSEIVISNKGLAGVVNTGSKRERLKSQQRAWHEQRQRLVDSELDGIDYGETSTLPIHTHNEHIAENETELMAFILEGKDFPVGVNSRVAKSVLQQLSGREELKDRAVLNRFHHINLMLSNVDPDELGITSDQKNPSGATV